MKVKRLIPAVAMLLVSAMLLGTSTFAWFSMSRDVTATDMEITAKSDAIFLMIQGADDAAMGTEGSAGVTQAVYPVHHESWDDVADIEDMDMAVADTYDNWYYRYSDDPASYNSNMTAKAYIDNTTDLFTDYVLKTSFDVQLKANSQPTGYDLWVSSITIPANKGIVVVIAGPDGYQEFSSSATPAFNAANVISDTVTAASATTIYVYIYINGDDTNVYTNNATNLGGEVEFVLSAFQSDN